VNHQPVHLHSMLVHAVVAFAPVAALSFVLAVSETGVGGIEPSTWRLLLWGSLVGMILMALPATWTGITERNHLYANWPPSHRAKLVLSLSLIVMVAGEVVALTMVDDAVAVVSALGLAIVVVNNGLALALSYFGLRISLGRQGLRPTSYVADMDRSPPVDILEVVAEHACEPARVIDVRMGEGES
jgi:hypothetical protein